MADEKKGGISVSEAGRRGGRKTAATHSHEFYEQIGRKGGQSTSEKYGAEFYEEIGHKGGQKVRDLIAQGKKKPSAK